MRSRTVIMTGAGLLGILAALTAVMAMVPPVSRDALTHHLLVPKRYLAAGGFPEMPRILFSYFPMNLDLLYMLPLAMGNDVIPKFIHFAFGLATAALLFFYIRSRLDTGYALAGSVLFLSLPVVVRLSTTAYVDLGLVFFSFAALLAIMKWRESGFSPGPLLLAGLLCGLAMGTKYNGLITWVLLSLAVPWLYVLDAPGGGRYRQPAALMWAGLFALTALLVFSPWAIRNWLWTGNPVYPLFPGVFGGAGEAGGGLGHFAVRKLLYHESLPDILSIPVRIFFQGRDNDPKYFDGRLNPALLLLPAAAFAGLKSRRSERQRENQLLLGFSILFLLIAFFSTDMRIRYVAPILPPLVILAIHGCRGVEELLDRRTSLSRGTVQAVVGLVILFFLVPNGVYIAELFQRIDPVPVITGGMSREAYIERHRPEYAVIRHANETLSGNIRIMGLFVGNRFYYSDHDMSGDNGRLEQAVRRSDDARRLREELVRDGYSHLIVGVGLFNAWRRAVFSDSENRRIDRFFQEQARLVYAKNGYRLYSLVD